MIAADDDLQKKYRCLVLEWRSLVDGGPLQSAMIYNCSKELYAVVNTLKSLFNRGVHNTDELTKLELEMRKLSDFIST
jgi:hypothetical protein